MTERPRILLAEDEQAIADTVIYALRGRYGARSTRDDPDDDSSSVILKSAVSC